MRDHPAAIVPVGHVEPVPRRVRATIGATTVLDTTRARYVWEIAYYPQFYVPIEDVLESVLIDEGAVVDRAVGPARVHGLRLGDQDRASCAWLHDHGDVAGLVRFDWSAMDAWFEEDEEVFVHPRSPYTRVDALRSTRTVRVEVDEVVLGESSSPVLVFETGLPTRYYLPRTAVRFEHLEPSDTVTECPYKGRTTGYWSARVGERRESDIAWSYSFPTRGVEPIAGLIAFFDHRVDLFLDGERLERPS